MHMRMYVPSHAVVCCACVACLLVLVQMTRVSAPLRPPWSTSPCHSMAPAKTLRLLRSRCVVPIHDSTDDDDDDDYYADDDDDDTTTTIPRSTVTILATANKLRPAVY